MSDDASTAPLPHEVRPYDSVVQIRLDGSEWSDYATVKTRDDFAHAKRLLRKRPGRYRYRVRTRYGDRQRSATATTENPNALRWHEADEEPKEAPAPAPGHSDPAASQNVAMPSDAPDWTPSR